MSSCWQRDASRDFDKRETGTVRETAIESCPSSFILSDDYDNDDSKDEDEFWHLL